MPLLIDMDSNSIQGPMTTLQLTNFDREDVTKLLRAINERTRTPLSDDLLVDQVKLLWGRLESAVGELLAKRTIPTAPKLDERDILEELLDGMRELRRKKEVRLPGYTLRPINPFDDRDIHEFVALMLTVIRSPKTLIAIFRNPNESVVTALLDGSDDESLSLEKVFTEHGFRVVLANGDEFDGAVRLHELESGGNSLLYRYGVRQ